MVIRIPQKCIPDYRAESSLDRTMLSIYLLSFDLIRIDQLKDPNRDTRMNQKYIYNILNDYIQKNLNLIHIILLPYCLDRSSMRSHSTRQLAVWFHSHRTTRS